MVSAYLELVELQALNRKPMYMKDWVERLDDFLKMTSNDILNTTGTINHEQALAKANIECRKHKELTKKGLSEVEKQFVKHIELTANKLKKQ